MSSWLFVETEAEGRSLSLSGMQGDGEEDITSYEDDERTDW